MKQSRTLGGLAAFALAAVLVFMGTIAPAEAFAATSPFLADPSLTLVGVAALGSIEQLRKLTATRDALMADMDALTKAAAATETGQFTEEARAKFDALEAQVKGLNGDITRVKQAMEAKRGVEVPGASRIEVVDNQRDAPNHGFRSFGEFAWAALRAGVGDTPDQRLVLGAASTAPSSYGNESSGADGGYVVPPEYSTSVIETAYNQYDSFMPMTDSAPVGGNSMAFPVDETTPWGSAGIKAYWTDEGGAGTESKAKLDPAILRLKKLMALVPLTDEMISDAAFIGAYVSRKVPEAITFKTNEALYTGNGIGKPLGFYASSGLLITVSKEASQAADTINADNVSKMRARMSARSWRRAIWQCNLDCLPQLDKLAYATTATNDKIYDPKGGKFGYGTLLGKDVMVTDFNETVGDKGDLTLVDWGMYRTITKAGGIETATSMHFWFDRQITAFRSTFRVDGQPSIKSPVTPNKGASTIGPIVCLEARA